MENKEKKLNSLLKENPDPSKWSKWLKIIIAILSAIVGAIAEDATSFINLF